MIDGYDKMTLGEKIEWHAFEERRHAEALRHLHEAKRAESYGYEAGVMVEAASKCCAFAFEDWKRHAERIGGEELRRVDVAELDAAVEAVKLATVGVTEEARIDAVVP